VKEDNNNNDNDNDYDLNSKLNERERDQILKQNAKKMRERTNLLLFL